MNILFIGDIVGKTGRNSVCDLLNNIKKQYNIDFTIANAENSAHGKGITESIYNQLIDAGVDAITMGNHTYSKKEIYYFIDRADRMIVPYNFKDRKGEGYRFFNINNKKICIINLLGKDLMGEYMNEPYSAMKEILLNKKESDVTLLDFHAESTAEKRIFFELFKNDIDIFVGTHTHVQSADESIIDGTAFITDVGMCGSYDSIIGRDIDESINMYVNKAKTHYTVAEGNPIFSACVINVDDNNTVKDIERILIK